MRIRRKKRLSQRLDSVNNFLIKSDFDILNVKQAVEDKKYLNFSKIFNNDNPVHLEIGCGKGGFIIELAKKYPSINFFAVELLENIVVMAAEEGQRQNLTNLRFFNCGADYLPRYIKDNSIEKIYLNFSPPYPGKRYENRRLTKPLLIEDYKKYLCINGAIEQRTDDKEFFEYSKNQFINFGFNVCDLSGDKILDNIVNIDKKTFIEVKTEYEKKFIALGKIIYRLVAKV